MTGKIYTAVAALIATLMLTTSCEYKELEAGFLSNMVKVTFQNKDAKMAVPATYRVVFYPVDEDAQEAILKGNITYDMTGDGRLVRLPSGRYNVTAWNTDTEHVIVYDEENRDSVVATTPTSSSLSLANMPEIMDSLYHGQKILDYPDYMLHGNVMDFLLESGDEEQELVIPTDSMVVSLHIKVSGIGGLDETTSIKGSLDHVAAKRYAAYDDYTKDTAVVLFDCYLDQEMNVCADINLFGLEPTDLKGLTHTLVLYFYLPEKNLYMVIDVTDQIRDKELEPEKIVEVDKTGTDLREFSRGASGFKLEIDEWEGEDIDLGL